ncbi:autorepressor SdpR family transcription factor [Myxococcota bacterium]|nr:autorepressor SdpR family transcription factor [Myxococcota bacterium]MBU1535189.1 autorepressor SdpR family transcription factor [Myxococcota bacterium]
MNDAFKALSDPTRRKILELLSGDDLCAGDIADHFSISKPSISHHLNLLAQAGLIDREKRGQQVIYSLNTTVFQEMTRWFFDFMKRGEDNEDS